MLHSSIRTVILRELGAVRRSVEAYRDDASLWSERPGLPNCAGTLVLHITGNIRHYLGAVLGGSGFQRDRPAEFARRGVSRTELLAEVDAAIVAVETTFTLRGESLDAQPSPAYPERVAGRMIATDDFLVHMATHLAYHLGQLDYHRRVVTGDALGIAALSPHELPEHRDGA
jgi:uncharacterized damage-inducible protein DinB